MYVAGEMIQSHSGIPDFGGGATKLAAETSAHVGQLLHLAGDRADFLRRVADFLRERTDFLRGAARLGHDIADLGRLERGNAALDALAELGVAQLAQQLAGAAAAAAQLPAHLATDLAEQLLAEAARSAGAKEAALVIDHPLHAVGDAANLARDGLNLAGNLGHAAGDLLRPRRERADLARHARELACACMCGGSAPEARFKERVCMRESETERAERVEG